jgi:phosphoribosylformylglycinamidine synthase
MLSESQERMLLVADRGREEEVLAVFRKWGLDAVAIGRVTSDGLLRVLDRGHIAAEIPTHPLAEEGPVYQRPLAAPTPRKDERLFEFAPEGTDLTENFARLLASPAMASKRWIFEQYDHMVRTNTLVAPGAGDADVLRIKGTQRALALSVDGNGRWCWLAPRTGAMHAVAEAARNVACAGARPWAATNCLNFGNPEKPEIMWQFSEAVDGIAEACRALDAPITGGNVSFYNETLGESIYPTPIVGVLGLIEDASRAGNGVSHRGRFRRPARRASRLRRSHSEAWLGQPEESLCGILFLRICQDASRDCRRRATSHRALGGKASHRLPRRARCGRTRALGARRE